MDLQKSVQQAWEVLLLKEPTMHALIKDPNALRSGFLIFAMGVVLAALGKMIFPSSMGMVQYRSGLEDVLLESALGVLIGVGMLYLAGYLAEKVFHSKLSTEAYVKIMAHAGLVNVLGIIPALSTVSGLWSLVVMCVVLNKLGHLQAGSIVLLILLEILVMAVLFGLLFATGMGMGGMMF